MRILENRETCARYGCCARIVYGGGIYIHIYVCVHISIQSKFSAGEENALARFNNEKGQKKIGIA